ncbi:hypothetical protein BDZ45DRAFT_666431 [Acephala macrosclerotiorum]|nr:hypothetical protein BDZ45DRAFT_666431 [Acephala macrosclerotiorum]
MDISTQDNINILVLGEFCCSTAGLCHQFTDNWWYDMGTYGPHYDTSWRKIFTVDGMPSLVDLDEVHDVWFLDHHSNFLARRAHAFILIYDVTSRKGFDFISRAHERVLEKSRNKPLSNASSGGVAARSAEMVSPSTPHAEGDPQSSLQKLKAKLHRRKDPFSTRLSEQPTANTFSCFPRLPLELQRAILRVCVTSSDPITDYKPHYNDININVLQVCKLFYEEGTKIFWAENTFTSSKPTYVVADMTWATPTTQQVASVEGRALADRLGCKFFESSSKVHEDVEAVFADIIRECRAREAESVRPLSIDGRFIDVRNTIQRTSSISLLAQSFRSGASRVFR